MCKDNQKMVTFDKKSSSESMEEYFDRISDENYERIDREFMRNIDTVANLEKTPRFFHGLILYILIFIASLGITRLVIYLLDKYYR